MTGKAAPVPELWRFLSGCDLALIINETIWHALPDKGRIFLLDHELSHFTEPTLDKHGNKKWSTREHDLEEFSEVVKRHGVCIGSSRSLTEAGRQMNLVELEAMTAAEEAESLGGEYDEDEDEDEDEAYHDGFEEE